MQTATKTVLWAICGSLIATPFTQPVSWYIDRWLNEHPDAVPGAVVRTWAVIQSVATYVPPWLFVGLAVGSAATLMLFRNTGPRTSESTRSSMDEPAAAAIGTDNIIDDRPRRMPWRRPLDETALTHMRQFVAGPMTEFHNGLVEIFFASYNTLRTEWQSNDLLHLCHDLFERCVRDEWERIQALYKTDEIDRITAKSAMMRYAQRFGESTEVMNIVAKNFDVPNSRNPNLPIWKHGRDVIASEARKVAVYPGLEFMSEVGERLRQEADRLNR